MTITTVNHDGDDPMILISQMYPGVYTQIAPQQETKPRRRRKKNKGGDAAVGAKKRKLSEEQVKLLEQNFGDEHKLESERKDRIASQLGLDPRQVAVWFQNRRARWKNKKLEEEYSKLKSIHDNNVLEKCLLESEVMKLKEQLLEAEREIQRLAERADGVSSNSTPSSSTAEAVDPPFFGEFGVVEDDVIYMPGNTGYVNGLEWINIYI